MAITLTLFQAYKAERANGERATHALHSARVRLAFKQAERLGLVRIRAVPDEDGSSVLDFDCDMPNCDTRHEDTLCKYHREALNRANNEGIYGMVGEYCSLGDECSDIAHGDTYDYGSHVCGCEWIEAYSCWGFIGDDWKNSGYDIDAMSSALSAVSAARLRMVA